MNPLTASRLLSVWERGYQQSPLNRALVMFEVAAPEFNRELVLSLPVGQRDALLFRLRERTFGSRFESEASCPSCGDHLEFSFEVTDILHNVDVQAPQTCVWNDRGYSLNYRPINTLDLLEASRLDYSRSAEMFVLERCIISAAHNGKETSLTELPSDVLDGLMTDMARTDPHADILVQLSCPSCSHMWEKSFDIVSYFWREIESRAKRLLQDVHRLARAYGWCESDILSMSTLRREYYLQMTS